MSETQNNMKIEIFHFENSTIRVTGTHENPMFVAKDVCDILGLTNVTHALKNIPDKWKDDITKSKDVSGREIHMLTVSEAGLYKLIIRSNKPAAEKFQEWICEQVLPSIRKKGEYVLEEYKKKLEEQQKALEEKTKEVETLTKRYVKKKVTVDGVNVVYLMTSEEGEKERLYAVGKSKILKSRVQGYNGNKIHDFKVVYHKSFKSVQIMTLAEKCVLLKLDEYKDKANRDVFKLQDGKDISLFTKILDDTSKFFENVSENAVLPIKSEEEIKKESREKAKEYHTEKKEEICEDHKERLASYNASYYSKKKDKIIENAKKYAEDHKEDLIIKRKELCVCECGMEITKLNMPRHILSKIHIQKMNLTCSAMTICSCGAEVTKAGIYKHKNTDKHKNRIKNLSSIQ